MVGVSCGWGIGVKWGLLPHTWWGVAGLGLYGGVKTDGVGLVVGTWLGVYWGRCRVWGLVGVYGLSAVEWWLVGVYWDMWM